MAMCLSSHDPTQIVCQIFLAALSTKIPTAPQQNRTTLASIAPYRLVGYPLTKRAILSAKLSTPLPSAWERRKMFSFLEGNDAKAKSVTYGRALADSFAQAS